MRLLPRRKSSTAEAEFDGAVEDAEESAVPASRSYTPGKGRPTPKRRDGQLRRPGPVAPPPRTYKEARQRDRSTGRRAEIRKGMAAGDERYLTKRDQGPAKALARDVVDSRRNLGSIFMLVALLVLVTYGLPKGIRTWAMSAVLVIFLMVAVDSFILARLIRKAVTERLPNEPTRGVGWYGVQRAMMIRRWRLPKAKVRPGQSI